MGDRDVLELALRDQEQARERIEELRQQIVDEEARIEAIGGFVETYRQYEERVSSQASSNGGSEGGEAQYAPAGYSYGSDG